MNEVAFLVQGSAAEPYEVLFAWAEDAFVATCTCPAGAMGTHCKHRIGIVTSDRAILAKIVQDQSPVSVADRVQLVLHAAASCDLHERLEALRQAELDVANSKARLAQARRLLVDSMSHKGGAQ